MGGRGIALWGGVECTVARIGDRYGDQVRRTGHHDRVDDIALIRSLGVRAVRYPVLWERVAPDGLARADWSWTDERLEALRGAGIEPIVTLMHHGSGPRHTSLLDPTLPAQLAAFAGAVARRYPWVKKFTPVNEPLTTARFSCLYGHWFPHLSDDSAFCRALIVEMQAVARSMEAIREVIPDAQLVQTDDLGKTFSTPALAYQAAFENERRWVTYDLLLGRTDTPFARWMREHGVSIADQRACATQVDIAGFNYYITSERFLDERLERYPGVRSGGNGKHTYVDIEVPRVCLESSMGIGGLLQEAWERFGIPMAVTESHIGATREQQVRWLEENYNEVQSLADRGVDMRAFTVWCLFGLVDWRSLLLRDDNLYEQGAFDARYDPPRITAIGEWLRTRAAGMQYHHPVLDGPGWWRTESRFHHSPVSRSGEKTAGRPWQSPNRAVMILGTSPLAEEFRAQCAQRDLLCSHHDPERAWLVIDVDRESTLRVARSALRHGARYSSVRTAGRVSNETLAASVCDLLDRMIDGDCGIFSIGEHRAEEAS